MDHNDLGKALDSLKLEDGKPDVLARRQQLDGLLSSLSNHEIRWLRNQLSEVTLQMDVCSRLPLEILSIVASHLDLEDVFRLRSVSRSWHTNFTNTDICLRVIKKHFPSAWIHFTEGLVLNPAGENSAKESLMRWFQAAAVNHIRKIHGRYQSMSSYHYNYHKSTELSLDHQVERQYNSGRVAFRMRSSGILMRNLRTGQVSRFLEKNRQSIREWFLSDQYLVASTVSPDTLCAWSLEDQDQLQSIRLPTRALKLTGRGNQVGIVTVTGDVLMWRLDGSLNSIDTSNYKIQPRSSRTNIFFPKDNQSFFVTCQKDNTDNVNGPENILHISVHEYDFVGKTTAYHIDISPRYLFMARLTPILSGSKIIWRLNHDCTYTVVSNNSPAGSCCKHIGNQLPDGSLLLITFDTLKKEFAFQTYHLPLHTVGLKEAFFWNDQAILPVLKTRHSSENHPSSVEDILLLAVNSCKGGAVPPGMIPWYVQRSATDQSIIFTPQDKRAPLSAVAWCWIGEDKFDRAMIEAFNEQMADDCFVHVCGDDDFVILLGREYGMVVWCFDKSVELPVSWSRRDPTVAETLKNRHPLSLGD